MGTFGKSFSREMGKNTGKWVSNKLFGDGHATPHKIIVARERENARKEREEARNYRENQKELERERRQREKEQIQLDREIAEKEKQLMIESNILEVEEHNNYLTVIQSVHKDYSKQMNWEELLLTPEPEEVKPANDLKSKIKQFTEEYINFQIIQLKEENKLSVLKLIFKRLYQEKYEWIFKTVSIKNVFIFLQFLILIGLVYSLTFDGILSTLLFDFTLLMALFIGLLRLALNDFNTQISLNENIDFLEEKRESWYQENLANQDKVYENYLKEKSEYEEMLKIANGVLVKNIQSYQSALKMFNPFEDLKEYGSEILFEVTPKAVNVEFYVHGKDVIPDSTKRILRKGLEIKEEQMPTTRFNEIYQDYVCSCILRIAKEIYQLLPEVNLVKINARGRVLNTSIGKQEEKIILSVLIEKQHLSNLNFELIDPSDSMQNFVNNMNFNKNVGFYPVDEIMID